MRTVYWIRTGESSNRALPGPMITDHKQSADKAVLVIGQFGPESTKTDRHWSPWTQIYQNGPSLVNLGPNLPKRIVIGQLGPKSTKTDRDCSTWTQIYQNGPWLVNLDPNLPKGREKIDRISPHQNSVFLTFFLIRWRLSFIFSFFQAKVSKVAFT